MCGFTGGRASRLLHVTLGMQKRRKKWQQLALLLLASALGATAQPNPPHASLPTLTRADQIRRLTVDESPLEYPVRIRGVITDDVPAPDFFVQDSTAGVYVEGNPDLAFPHHLGDLVEVEGITGPGRFAPVVKEQKFRVVGKGTLPAARLYQFGELADGQHDSQWVKIRGIVRSVAIDRTSWKEVTLAMTLASGGGQFKVRVPISHEQDFASYVDSEILIEGVCGSLFNAERQLVGLLFYVPRLSFIQVETAASDVPFSALLRFSPGSSPHHRVRVRGVVGYQEAGHAIFLQNGGRGLRVLTQQATVLQIGDLVDAVGFPAMGESAPVLEDAVFHRVSHEAPPTPVNFDPNAPWEQYDGTVITLPAKLVHRQSQSTGLTLLLLQGDILFEAALPPGEAADRLASIPLNSQVAVTGISLVRSGGLWRVPESFRVLLRSQQDVAVISAPSWWNARHTLWVLGITAGILLAMIAWVVVLGRRVRGQMAIIRQKLRSSAVLEERNRIARELHDTVEQELAGITMQLDLAVDCFQQAPPVARQALETARNMSRHSMVDARRSVWDLRCHFLENGDLVSAMKNAVESLNLRDRVQVDVKVEGSPVRMASSMEMNLLRIGQEAVVNAAKHGCAHHIEIALAYARENVRLCVRDDGRGFDPAQTASTGHFGLLDMRERARCLGCDLQIDSRPGAGTAITVDVSIKPQSTSDAELKADTYSGR
jgi:signal transduction histidine kinase